MTDENKSANIQEELARAASALRAASLLAENNLLNDAVSRLYYFLLYHVRALLLTVGLEARSHETAPRLFGLHFVRKGIFGRDSSHLFSVLMKYREEADYNPFYSFTQQDFQELKGQVVNLASKIKTWIREQGYL